MSIKVRGKFFLTYYDLGEYYFGDHFIKMVKNIIYVMIL